MYSLLISISQTDKQYTDVQPCIRVASDTQHIPTNFQSWGPIQSIVTLIPTIPSITLYQTENVSLTMSALTSFMLTSYHTGV